MVSPSLPLSPGAHSAHRFTLSVLLIAFLLGLGVAFLNLTLRHALVLAIATSLTAPLLLRLVYGNFDPFEPLVLANGAMLVIFVLRPIADLTFGSMPRSHTSINPTFDASLLLALVGATAFQLGYHSRIPQRLVRDLPTQSPSCYLHPGRATKAALLVAAVGVVLYCTFILTSGGLGLLLSLLDGRDTSQGPVFQSALGYLYRGQTLLIPATLTFLLLKKQTRQFRFLLMAAGTGLPLVILAGSTGTRLTLLLLLAPAFLFAYLSSDSPGGSSRGRRPTVLGVAILAFLLVVVGFSLIRLTRTAGDERTIGGTAIELVTAPVSATQQFLTSGDTSMFDSLNAVVAMIPERLPYQHGSLIKDPLIRAAPSALWPGMPRESNAVVMRNMDRERFDDANSAAATSIVGYLYYDSGYITVVGGMFSLGIALAILWQVYVRSPAAVTTQLLYAATVPLIIVLIRGTLPATMTHGAFVLIPLYAIIRFARSRSGPHMLRRGKPARAY